jgi:hypothetical protein
MSAVMLNDFCFTFDAGCSGQTSLVVFSEPMGRVSEVEREIDRNVERKAEPQRIESRSEKRGQLPEGIVRTLGEVCQPRGIQLHASPCGE